MKDLDLNGVGVSKSVYVFTYSSFSNDNVRKWTKELNNLSQQSGNFICCWECKNFATIFPKWINRATVSILTTVTLKE